MARVSHALARVGAAALLSTAMLAAGAPAPGAPAVGRGAAPLTPPMGMMTWQKFRCNGPGANGPLDDCTDADTTYCISHALIVGQAAAMARGGFVAAGYNLASIDDCWMSGRSEITHELTASAYFPNASLAATAAAVHAHGMLLGTYTAESPVTCCGHAASAGYEAVDAATFARWGVDYLKADGCYAANVSYYAVGYPLMGRALQESGRAITFSCSWPDYEMCDVMHDCGNVSVVDWPAVVAAGCSQWRVWRDIDCTSASLFEIIDHFGDYAPLMAPIHGPGRWFDADQLLIGAGCLTPDEERAQLALWAVLAQPLIVSADFRNMSAASAAVLLNEAAIAIDQDALGAMGRRLGPAAAPAQVWARRLANGDVAVALLNRHGAPAPCGAWEVNHTGYLECKGGCCEPFSNLTLAEAEAACCALGAECAGLSFPAAAAASGARDSGCFKAALDSFQPSVAFVGASRAPWPPPAPPGALDIGLNFTDVGLPADARVDVFDVWAGASAGVFEGAFVARGVAYHAAAFFRLAVL